jgi:cytochrome c oxidase cbb3-type subunit IV
MDVDALRSVMTVLSFIAFVAIVAWAWSARARPAFERAARLPFEEDADTPEQST